MIDVREDSFGDFAVAEEPLIWSRHVMVLLLPQIFWWHRPEALLKPYHRCGWDRIREMTIWWPSRSRCSSARRPPDSWVSIRWSDKKWIEVETADWSVDESEQPPHLRVRLNHCSQEMTDRRIGRTVFSLLRRFNAFRLFLKTDWFWNRADSESGLVVVYRQLLQVGFWDRSRDQALGGVFGQAFKA